VATLFASREIKVLARREQLHSDIEAAGPGEQGRNVVLYEQAFHDEQAAYYDDMYSDPEPTRSYMRQLNDEVFELVKGSRFVVDLCAGTGKSSLPLLKRGVQVVAVDISAGMLSVYARKAKGLPGLTLIQGDATNPPLDPDSCPAIMMIGGLHHIPDQAGAVLNACRALKPGGMLFIHEPIVTGQSHWVLRVIRNIDAVTNVPRLVRAVARRLGRATPPATSDGMVDAAAAPLTQDGRLRFTPYEKQFRSPDELTAIIPETMEIVDLRSKFVLSDYPFGAHLQLLGRPLGTLVATLDNWLSRTGRAGWTGSAIWCVARKRPSGAHSGGLTAPASAR
jgi:ubiquinone/menaquinone biosynthesis C-methylase UbiE